MNKYLQEAKKDLMRLENAYVRLISYISKIDNDKSISEDDKKELNEIKNNFEQTIIRMKKYVDKTYRG